MPPINPNPRYLSEVFILARKFYLGLIYCFQFFTDSINMACNRPGFMKGYDTSVNKTQYMNVGWVESPYPGKTGEGDWGPQQGGEVYYRPANHTYPYPMFGFVPHYPQYPSTFPPYVSQQQGNAPLPRGQRSYPVVPDYSS